MHLVIDRLVLPASDRDLRELASLLSHTVNSGGAVSFIAPLGVEQAEKWWRKTLAASQSRAVFLVARDDDGIAGTVQLHPAWPPNQPHRADVAKLMVDERARRAGVGTMLMQRLESLARAAGFDLLTLDTRRGDAAEWLYRKLEWTEVGIIPGYAVNNDGTLHDTVIFYKHIAIPLTNTDQPPA